MEIRFSYSPSLILSFAAVLLPFLGMTQSYSILYKSGKVNYHKAGFTKFEACMDGQKLNVKDVVQTGPNSFVYLTYSDGTTFQLGASKTATLGTLEEMRRNPSGIVFNRFFNYVAATVTEKEGGAKYQIGGQSRTIGGQTGRGNFLMRSPIEGEVVDTGMLTFKWKNNGSSEYVFTLYGNRNSRPILTQNLKDTFITLPTNQIQQNKQFDYYWHVRGIDDEETEGDEFHFTFNDKKTETRVDSMLAMVKQQLTPGPMLPLVQAKIYEAEGLFERASSTYANTKKAYPKEAIVLIAEERYLKWRSGE